MDNKFNWQSFISIGLLISFMVVVFSGIVLFVAPEGSLSRWIGWEVFNLSKKQWEHQHTIFSYVFVLFGIFHIVKINWGLLLSYFIPDKIKFSHLKEILIAIVLSMFFFLGTLFEIGPLKLVLNFGDYISDSHSENVDIPFLSDSENLSIEEFSVKVMSSNYEKVQLVLGNLNFNLIKKDILVKDFCDENKITPQEFYKILKGELFKIEKEGVLVIPEIAMPLNYTNRKYSIL